MDDLVAGTQGQVQELVLGGFKRMAGSATVGLQPRTFEAICGEKPNQKLADFLLAVSLASKVSILGRPTLLAEVRE